MLLQKTAKKMKKKKSKASSEKKNPNSWSYFCSNKNITHSDYCVIKSWRLAPRQCPTASSRRRHPTLVEIDGKYISSWTFKLACKHGVSTPYRSDGYSVSMAVTGDCTPAFACSVTKSFRSEPSKTRENCDIKEPYDSSQKMQFCQIIEFKGRFYATSLQGSVVVIEKEEETDDSDRFVITRIGGNRAVPSKACRQFREYLVESHEEILAVFLVSKKSVYVVDDVEVLRLDTEKLLWVQVENIGERAFFLEDKDCVKFEACERGFKRNCIYFTHSWSDDWMVFNMETRLILPHLDVKIETQ